MIFATSDEMSSSIDSIGYAIVASREPDKLSSTTWSKISGEGGSSSQEAAANDLKNVLTIVVCMELSLDASRQDCAEALVEQERPE